MILRVGMTRYDDDDDAVIESKKQPLITTPTPSLPFLGNDLIVEIMLRLPARSLLQLKSVCSSWRTLISSSKFATEHLRRSLSSDPTSASLRIAYHNLSRIYRKIGDFSVQSVLENSFYEPTRAIAFGGRNHYRIIGSCNGLLCLQHNTDRNNHAALLWNPCTGFTSQSLEIGGFLSLCGFGYDHVSDSYKLFGIVTKNQKPRESATRVFTFGSNSSGRTIQDIPLTSLLGEGGRVSITNKIGIFVNASGTLNWIVWRELCHFAILSLDLGKETYRKISLPSRDCGDDPGIIPELCVLRNCLAVCFDHKKTHWVIWLMKENDVTNQCWTQLAKIPNFPQFINPQGYVPLRPLYVSENDVLMAVAPTNKIVLHNLKDGGMSFPIIYSPNDGMSKHPPLFDSSGTRCFHIYRESLVLPSHCGVLQSCSTRLL
ncbi:hypothetical protein PIB30_093507 [Stylosanthes scabra]|uniref:F-box domain-containing protein n=1 Tax=Stylosanthes scabra TaxID=79078 RepID=A0ABU6XWY1_9FABA|nr:hypothetical protein [Stylosanthes scabra]